MSFFSNWKPFEFLRKRKKSESDDSTSTSGRGDGESRGTAEGDAPARTSNAPPSPADSMLALHREMGEMMDRMFADRWGTSWRSPARAGDTTSWFGDFRPAVFSPSVDVTQEKDCLSVTAELPGMTADDVDVRVEPGRLLIRGEKRHEDERDEEGCYRIERSYGAFERVLPLPADADVESADASFENGVLRVKLPRSEAIDRGPRRIPIGS